VKLSHSNSGMRQKKSQDPSKLKYRASKKNKLSKRNKLRITTSTIIDITINMEEEGTILTSIITNLMMRTYSYFTLSQNERKGKDILEKPHII